MFKKNHNAKSILYIIYFVALSWVGISSSIQRFKCPKMTETELFINIPKSFICEWVCCN